MQESKVDLGPEWQEVRLSFRFPKQGDKRYHEKMKTLVARVDVFAPEGVVWVDDVDLRTVEVADEWESWQAQGLDTHSLVADPLFVDAANDDYQLRPDSPAFELGFKPIPFEKIGPYADPLRASWPIVEARGFRELARKKPAEPAGQ